MAAAPLALPSPMLAQRPLGAAPLPTMAARSTRRSPAPASAQHLCLHGAGPPRRRGSLALAAPAGGPLRRAQTRRQRQGAGVAASAASSPASGGGAGFSPGAAAGVAAVLATGVANRVLYRLALVPMKDHTFALAQFQNVGYIAIYSSLLALRYRQGKVTKEMLAIPKARFLLIGACEALGQLLMMAGAAHLPGALLPLLSQTSLFWQVAFSALLLGARPTASQLLGVVLVASGVALASLPPPAGAAAGGSGPPAAAAALAGRGELWHVSLCAASYAFPSLAVIVKERLFRDARKSLGRDLDVLVVNTLGSSAQALFVLLLMPLITAARGLPLSALPQVLSDGGRALAGLPAAPGSTPPAGAPLFPAAYVAVNVAFNIAALTLVRSSGAVAAGLSMACLVPLAVLAFTLPLPLLPRAELGAAFWAGCGLLMAGLACYNWRRAPAK